MATPTTGNRPTPERIFNTLNAHEQTAALLTAIELDIFTAIGAGANTAAAIATRTGAAEKGARVLCDFMTVHGFLTKDLGKYALTQESALFLDANRRHAWRRWQDFWAANRRGAASIH